LAIANGAVLLPDFVFLKQNRSIGDRGARSAQAHEAGRLPLDTKEIQANQRLASPIYPADLRLHVVINIKNNAVDLHADEVFLL
jgi:hypothetical protein